MDRRQPGGRGAELQVNGALLLSAGRAGRPPTSSSVLLSGSWPSWSSPQWGARLPPMSSSCSGSGGCGRTSTPGIPSRGRWDCTGVTPADMSCRAIVEERSAHLLRRPPSTLGCLSLAVPLARGPGPTRPTHLGMQPGCGCMEGGRRLAGPGLGDVATPRSGAKIAGRSRLRRADPLPTAVGGRWAWAVMRRTPRGTPDKPPLPPMLCWLINGRREESL